MRADTWRLFRAISLVPSVFWFYAFSHLRDACYPIIEDEVRNGPHAIVVVGDVTIGRDSRFASGAFVTYSVVQNSLVVGNPAVVANTDCRSDIFNSASLS